MQLEIITTGGTIDKVYFDAKSDFQVGAPQINEVLRDANLCIDYRVTPLLRKDSLDLTDADREAIRAVIAGAQQTRVVVTHGTDTMTDTARVLASIPDKTIVLTGSLSPARFAATDASFNVGMAFAAAQTLPPGVYVAMSGQVFDGLKVRKDVEANRFVEC